MYKKKYGKMTGSAWLNMEMKQTRPALMLALGGAMLAGGMAVRFAVGSPHLLLLSLNAHTIVPPVWLMTLLWSVSFFVIGAAAGFVLGYRVGGCEIDKYKGGMLFVLLAVLELCWYPTFFGACMIFLSALETVVILCLSVGVTFCFYRVSKFAGVLLLMHDVWLVYMLILNFAILFGS